MNKKMISVILCSFVAITAVVGGTVYLNRNVNDSDITKLSDDSFNTDDAIDSANAGDSNTLDKLLAEAGENAENTNDDEVKENAEVNAGVEDLDVPEEVTEDAAEGTDTEDEVSALVSNLSFGEADKLFWPVEGEVIMSFNMDSTVYFSTLNEYKCSPAILIQSEEGENVVASASGVVTEVGTDDKIGNYITMALGDDYEVTYGQLDEVMTTAGQIVDAKDIIATVASPTRYYTNEGTNLYFMLTKDQEPQDPLDYLD